MSASTAATMMTCSSRSRGARRAGAGAGIVNVAIVPPARDTTLATAHRDRGPPASSISRDYRGGKSAPDTREPMAYRIIRSDTVHAGRSKFLLLTVQLPDGQTMRREVEDHGAAVCVLPYDAERRTAILVRQFRAPVFLATRQEEVFEAIAGIVESPDPAACGRREAMEEAGLELHTLEHVGSAWTMPGVSTERMHLYVAPYGAN